MLSSIEIVKKADYRQEKNSYFFFCFTGKHVLYAYLAQGRLRTNQKPFYKITIFLCCYRLHILEKYRGIITLNYFIRQLLP